MDTTLKIKAKKTIMSLNELDKGSNDGLFRKFFDLSERKRLDLKLTIISQCVKTICERGKTFSSFKIEIDGANVKFLIPVTVTIKGDRNGKSDQKVKVTWNCLTLESPSITGDGEVKYDMTLNPFDPIAKWKKFNVCMSNSQRKILDECSSLDLWEKILPKNVDFYTDKACIGEIFIKKLAESGTIELTDDEVKNIGLIYKGLMHAFPLFEKKPIKERIKLIENVLKKCRKEMTKDINQWAEITFYHLYNLKLHKQFLSNGVLYYLVEEHRTNEYLNGQCIVNDRLQKLIYRPEGKKYMECFLPFNLWKALIV